MRPLLRTARFRCPHCLSAGRDVLITAEYEMTSVGRIVADLSGCPHADGFGHPDRLTPVEERELIDAALVAARPSRSPRAKKPTRPSLDRDIDLRHDA